MEEARRKIQLKYNEEAEAAAKKEMEVSNNQFQVPKLIFKRSFIKATSSECVAHLEFTVATHTRVCTGPHTR
jgi:hypothetical protein